MRKHRKSSAVAAFRRDRKRWRLRQQRCLEVAPPPAMLAWSMRRVGLIDTTVGNAARLGSSPGASQRSTTRRCASHHIATQRASRRGHPGASRAFSADIAKLKRWTPCGHSEGVEFDPCGPLQLASQKLRNSRG